MKRVLVLSPHPDDAELGCGGTMSRLRAEGTDVIVLRFSDCPNGRSASEVAALRAEAAKSASVIGFVERWLPSVLVGSLCLPNRHFPQHRQAILDWLIDMRGELSPDAVFAPSSYDTHQDHGAVHDEAVRAFRHCTLYGYELPWNTPDFHAQHFICLGAEHVERKWKALDCYESESHKSYMTEDYVWSWARYRGQQAIHRTSHAEAFEVIRSFQ